VSRGNSRAAVERVWAEAGGDARTSLERGLNPSDLNTLLMSVSRARASAVSPARLLQRWQNDRYVKAAASDPRRLWRVEHRLWDLLPDNFVAIDLSPVTPLGTCSAVAPVDQNLVISTTRGTEVISDPTNVLALEAATRRKQLPTETVHLAACHRVLRAQPFDGDGLFQHFRIFALVSSGRDRGSGSTEAAMLETHLRFWLHAITDLVPGTDLRVEFTGFDSPVLRERFHDTVRAHLEPLPERARLYEDPSRERARGYYRAGALRLAIGGQGREIEIGDGGFTDWTAQLMADNKERCLISCIGTERLTSQLEPSAPAAGG
jgi:hypothetical protein